MLFRETTLSASWCYILEASPWWGGISERMVQVAKRSPRNILLKSKLTYEELLTVIFEIESVVNWRPLCYVYDDGIEEVITPSHLLLGRRVLTKLDSDFNENNMDRDVLSRRVHYLQALIVHYCNRWWREHLPELRERHKLTNVIPYRQIKLNEVVIIEETHVPRSRWKIDHVEEFVTSKDGFNPGCKLCVIGKQGHYFVKRPVNKLCPLGIQNFINSVVKNSNENDDVIDYGRANRPQRLAAERHWFDNWINKNKIEWLINCLQIKVGSVKNEASIYLH